MKRENGKHGQADQHYGLSSRPSQTCYVEVLVPQCDPGPHLEAGSLTADIIDQDEVTMGLGGAPIQYDRCPIQRGDADRCCTSTGKKGVERKAEMRGNSFKWRSPEIDSNHQKLGRDGWDWRSHTLRGNHPAQYLTLKPLASPKHCEVANSGKPLSLWCSLSKQLEHTNRTN